jgi:hypothetical protein
MLIVNIVVYLHKGTYLIKWKEIKLHCLTNLKMKKKNRKFADLI